MKPLYCIYQHGLAEYMTSDLTSALRYIAKRMGRIISQVTMKMAVDNGWEVKVV